MMNSVVQLERVMKALANRRRLAIIAYLNRGPASVSDIAGHLRLSLPATSRHLRQLANAELAEFEQTSTTISYSLPRAKHPALEAALKSLK